MHCRTRTRIILSIFLSFLFVGSAVTFSADWPHWRGPDYNGISVETDWNPQALTDPAKPLWTASVGTGFSSISVANGKAVTMGNTDKKTDAVTCFDAETGVVLWIHSYKEPLTANLYEGGPNATPTIHEGKVYTVSKTGKVFCLNLENGEVIWSQNLDVKKPEWGYAGSPVIYEDKVIYNIGSHGLALNKDTGAEVWRSGPEESGYATAVPFTLDDQPQMVMFSKDQLFGINPVAGNVFWSYPWKTSWNVNASDPVIKDNEILITSGYNHGIALLKLNSNTPELVWENKNMRSQLSGPVLIDGYIYGIDDNKLVCLVWETGEKKWEEKSVGKGSLMAAGDKLIILSEKGKLIIAQATPEKFAEISSVQILKGRCWTMPVLSGGRIYARNAKGDLVCIDVSKKESQAALLHSAPVIAAAVMEEAPLKKKQWNQWQGPERDNKSPETGLLTKWPPEGPRQLWTASNLGMGYSSVSIADQKIYATGMKDKRGVLSCFNWEGTLLWTADYGPEWTGSFPGVRCTPVLYDGYVYVISGQGRVVCLSAETGREKWSADPFTEFEGQMPRWGVSMSPVIVKDKLIFVVGGKKATVVALDVKKGFVIWASESIGDKSAYCTPAVAEWAGRTILVGMTEKHLFAVDAKAGDLFWKYPMENYITGRIRGIHPNTPVYHKGAVLFTSGYDMGAIQFSLLADGWGLQKEWTNPDLDCHHGGAVYHDGYIYTSNWDGNDDGSWICVDWKTGETMVEKHWKNKGSIIWADDLFYIYTEKPGTVGLMRADSKDFEVISEFEVSLGEKEHWAHPVISGGRLFIRHGDVLMVYDITA